jgi:hypothetical protein
MAQNIKYTANAILGGVFSCNELSTPDPYTAIDEFLTPSGLHYV